MHTLYDIIISVAIGGMILSMIVSFNGYIVQEGSAQTIKIMAQTNLTAITDILDNSLRKLGYGITVSSDSAILIADSNKIKFKGDFDNTGSVDTLTYFLSPTARTGNTNTSTRALYRTFNSQAAQFINVGMTSLRFVYYDAAGTPYTAYPVSRPSLIKSFKVALNVESTVPYKIKTEKYVKLNPGVYWERAYKPKNLK
ncbi:MAG TPA: hypothetical protein VI215_04885 [Bacteroidota bacterium]